MAARIEQASATAKIQDGPLWLKSVLLTAGIDAASVTIEDTTGGGGTDLITLKAAANSSVQWRSGDRQGVWFKTAIHATFTGTTPFASFEYEQG